MTHPRTDRLQTDRLQLRGLRRDDAARIALLAGDYEIASMSAAIPHPYREDQAAAWIGEVLAGEEGDVFAITQADELIGCIGYRPQDAFHAELGYWIGKPYWGRGYATEAARCVIGEAFAARGFAYLLCGHFEDNPASRRVIQKLGFTPCGERLRHAEARDAEIRVLFYRLTRGDAGSCPTAGRPRLREEASY